MKPVRRLRSAARFLPVVVVLAVAIPSCDPFALRQYLDEPDVTAPIPGGSITISNLQFNFFDASWSEADDDWTPKEDLEYAVYGSQFNSIETLVEAEVYAEFSRGWDRGRYSLSADELDGAIDGTPYYLNVFVRDGEGNTASYGQVVVTPTPQYDIFVWGAGDVPRVYRNYSDFGGPIAYGITDVRFLNNFGADGPVAIADIIGNGVLDLVQGQTGGPIRFYVNTGDWSDNGLMYFQELAGAANEFDDAQAAVELGEFTGDGAVDLLAVGSGAVGAHVAANQFGQFSTTPIAQADSDWNTVLWTSTSSVAVADLNNDGLDDIVLGTAGSDNMVFSNLGNGVFRSGATDLPGDGVVLGADNTYKILVAPITTGDDDPDILAINDGDMRLDIGAGDGQTFTQHIGATGTTLNARSGAVADFDGDGDLDVAVGKNESVEITVYLNVGITNSPTVGSWSQAWSNIDLPGVADTVDLAAADLDGDGDPDLVAISVLDQVLMVWSNEGAVVDGDVTFEAAYGFPVSLAPMTPTQLKVVPLVP